MLIACWSPKGGSGTTVVSCALALSLANRPLAGAERPGVLLADLAGDAPAALGMPGPAGPGLADWLAAGAEVPVDALARLEVEAAAGVRLLPWAGSAPDGGGPAGSGHAGRAEVLATLLGADPRAVVADCGPAASGAGLALAAGAHLSLMVLRPCYLALRRALQAPLRPSGVVLVSEPGRAVTRHDVEEVLGVPVRAVVEHDPAVARAVDAGLLASRVPRGLERALRAAA